MLMPCKKSKGYELGSDFYFALKFSKICLQLSKLYNHGNSLKRRFVRDAYFSM